MLRFKVYQDGDFQRELEVDEEVIKIGKLRGAHLCLDGDGVARMHAVIEHNDEGEYRLIDLGSFKGSMLNGEKIEKNTVLPSEGTLRFGSFEVKYEIAAATAPVFEDPPSKLDELISQYENATSRIKERTQERAQEKGHHWDLLQSLIAELKRVDPDAAGHAEKMQAVWPMHSDQRRREWLRLLVRGIREARAMEKMFQRKRVATMMNLGVEGIEKVFSLSQEEALVGAHEMLLDMAMSKQALTMLDSMGFLKAMKDAIEKLPEPQKSEAVAEHRMFSSAHAQLVDRLQNAIVAGTSMLPIYLSRAGGREATDEDRAQWRAAFDEITKANKAN